MQPTPGKFLKEVRDRLRYGLREVQQFSEIIAAEENNKNFYISAARLAQVENEDSPPSVFKIFTLSAIYGLDFIDTLKRYGVAPDRVHYLRSRLKRISPHLISSAVHSLDTKITLPVRLDPAFRWETTQLLNRVVALWGEIPAALLVNCNPRRHMYGYVGLNGHTMFPLLRPGAVVKIDGDHRRVSEENWRSEFERPIYFVELREAYRCSWCQVDGPRITLIPYPASRVAVQSFSLGSEAEVVGQVVGVAMRLVPPDQSSTEQSSRPPKLS